MFRTVLNYRRQFCRIVSNTNSKELNKLEYGELHHPVKVPLSAIASPLTAHQSSRIGAETIQLLERLALVDLDGEEARTALESSIQFADRISNVNTDNVCPLYSVAEVDNLYLRADQVTDGNCREDILYNSKVTDEEYFVSPTGNIPLQQEKKEFSVI